MRRFKPQKRRVNLFFIELIVAILFFMLCATVCVLLFVKSHTISAGAGDVNHAVLQAQTAASALRGGEGDPAKEQKNLKKVFPEGRQDGDTFTVWYDKDWKPCEAAAASYRLTLRKTEKNSFPQGEINVNTVKDDSVLYSLEVTTEKGGNAK